MPSIEMFRMLGSGTEGIMAAIRAARAFTHKKYVIKVGGAYHGWSDPMVYGLHVPGTGRFEAARHSARRQRCHPGILPQFHCSFAPPFDLQPPVRRDGRGHPGTAWPESGTRRFPLTLTGKYDSFAMSFGALLIFDEVVTGFPGRHGERPGVFWDQTRPDCLRKMHHRRLPDGRRRGRAARTWSAASLPASAGRENAPILAARSRPIRSRAWPVIMLWKKWNVPMPRFWPVKPVTA